MTTRPVRRRRALGGGLLGAAAGAAAGALVLLPDRVGLDRQAPFAQLTAFRVPLVFGGAVVAVLLTATALGVVAHRAARGLRRSGASIGPVAPRHVLGGAAGLLATVLLAAAPMVDRVHADAVPVPGRPLSVLSLNTFAGKADPHVLAVTVATERPDLVVLIEAGERYRNELAARPEFASYRSWRVGEDNPPYEDASTLLMAGPSMGELRVREIDLGTRYGWLEAEGGALGATRIVAAHVASPVSEWITRWPGELELLRGWCAGGSPTILVGDLNATPDHSAFRAGTRGCTDAASATGRGLEGTWPAWLPASLRTPIDHVLLTGGPRAVSVDRSVVPGSDHLATIARLVGY